MSRKVQRQLREEIISQTYFSVINILEDSNFYTSKYWPSNGFVIGGDRRDNRSDIIYIDIKYYLEFDIGFLILSNWAASQERAIKQRSCIHNLFDNKIYDGFLFLSKSDEIDDKSYHIGCGNCILDMISIKFTIFN